MVIGDDQPEKLREMKERLHLDVPFLVDPNGAVGQQYGLLYTPEDRGGHLEPGVFILGQGGTLMAGSYVTGSVGRMPVADALNLLRYVVERSRSS